MDDFDCNADERLDEAIRAKTAAERLAIVDGMWRSARRMIWHHLQALHPEWSDARLDAEVARRLAGGAR
ncbi:MAG: hypothetical protein KDA21_12540 [Phycisphaerales bacterium]|nr:hypothetical protein [Phycisphaerales bacterium]